MQHNLFELLARLAPLIADGDITLTHVSRREVRVHVSVDDETLFLPYREDLAKGQVAIYAIGDAP